MTTIYILAFVIGFIAFDLLDYAKFQITNKLKQIKK